MLPLPADGYAVLRDQKPILPAALGCALTDMTPTEWYRELSGRVFMFASRPAMRRLLDKYTQKQPQVLFFVDTAALLARHGERVSLTAINTGAASRKAPPRGSSTFQRIADFEYDRSRPRGRRIAEVTVDWAIPDFAELLVRVEAITPSGSEILRTGSPTH